MIYRPSGTLAHDNRLISARSLFKRAVKLERAYASRLRQAARHIGDIVRGFDPDTLLGEARAQAALVRYGDALSPWAEAVANRMVTEVAAADRQSWRRASKIIGRQLAKEIETAPTGLVMRDSLQRQVGLIKSLPVEAAQRIHTLTTEGLIQGRRTSAIIDDIMRSGEVARSRAELIATTEVSRTASELTKARAEHVGSVQYIWRTIGDGSVRHDHRILNGRVFSWDDPPIADQRTGARAHPGCTYRCRCYPEPVI